MLEFGPGGGGAELNPEPPQPGPFSRRPGYPLPASGGWFIPRSSLVLGYIRSGGPASEAEDVMAWRELTSEGSSWSTITCSEGAMAEGAWDTG
eukprot:scaffold242063_cov42-Prasinocladus_malaysianus.AAC.2